MKECLCCKESHDSATRKLCNRCCTETILASGEYINHCVQPAIIIKGSAVQQAIMEAFRFGVETGMLAARMADEKIARQLPSKKEEVLR